jgi:hypothetical protein
MLIETMTGKKRKGSPVGGAKKRAYSADIESARAFANKGSE